MNIFLYRSEKVNVCKRFWGWMIQSLNYVKNVKETQFVLYQCCWNEKDMLKQFQVTTESFERCGESVTLAYYQKLGGINKSSCVQLFKHVINLLNTNFWSHCRQYTENTEMVSIEKYNFLCVGGKLERVTSKSSGFLKYRKETCTLFVPVEKYLDLFRAYKYDARSRQKNSEMWPGWGSKCVRVILNS